MAALLWAGAVGGGLLWWLHKPQATSPKALPALTSHSQSVDQGQTNVLRVLGGVASSEERIDFEKQFALVGVIAGAAGHGSALINIKGQEMANIYRVGDIVGDQWTIKTVTARSVALQARDGELMQLELPKTD